MSLGRAGGSLLQYRLADFLTTVSIQMPIAGAIGICLEPLVG
jgi:hypothetical protein